MTGQSIFEGAVKNADEAAEAIAQGLDEIKECPGGGCPVCAIAAEALSSMSESLQMNRDAMVRTTLVSPTMGHDLAIGCFALAQSYRAHAAVTLTMVRVTHQIIEGIAEGHIAMVIETHADEIRTAHESALKKYCAAGTGKGQAN